MESEDLADNRKIGQGILKIPARLPAQTPIEVTFYMSETGLLTVRATEPALGHEPAVRPADRGSRPGRDGQGTAVNRTSDGPNVVGIDLGTTNSVVASVDEDGTVAVLPNVSGCEITPSVVYIRPDGSVVVGEDAVQSAAIDPDNGVHQIKRAMGMEFPLRIRGREHTPESISALILRQLACAAVGRGAKVSAVITVPAYFGLAEREATYRSRRHVRPGGPRTA